MYSIPLENIGALYLDQIEYPSPKDAKLVEIGQVVLEKKMKMRKVYNNDNN